MGVCGSIPEDKNSTIKSNMGKPTPKKKISKADEKMLDAKKRQQEAFLKERQEKEKRRAGQCELALGITEAQAEENQLLVLSKSTHFSVQKLRQLEVLFEQISNSQKSDSFIDRDELAEAMGLRPNCLLLETIFRLFDATSSKQINFKTWAITLSSLSTQASLDEKVQLTFSLYDLNKDGSIDLSELQALLEAIVREKVVDLSAEDVRDICRQTLKEVDSDGNGQVDFSEYSHMIRNATVFLESFSIDVERFLETLSRFSDHTRSRTPSQTPTCTTPSHATSEAKSSSMTKSTVDSRGPKSPISAYPNSPLTNSIVVQRQDAFKNRKIILGDSSHDILEGQDIPKDPNAAANESGIIKISQFQEQILEHERLRHEQQQPSAMKPLQTLDISANTTDYNTIMFSPSNKQPLTPLTEVDEEDISQRQHTATILTATQLNDDEKTVDASAPSKLSQETLTPEEVQACLSPTTSQLILESQALSQPLDAKNIQNTTILSRDRGSSQIDGRVNLRRRLGEHIEVDEDFILLADSRYVNNGLEDDEEDENTKNLSSCDSDKMNVEELESHENAEPPSVSSCNPVNNGESLSPQAHSTLNRSQQSTTVTTFPIPFPKLTGGHTLSTTHITLHISTTLETEYDVIIVTNLDDLDVGDEDIDEINLDPVANKKAGALANLLKQRSGI